jgi:hypothetical protein
LAVLAFAPARTLAEDDKNDKDWKVLGDAKLEREAGTKTIDVGAEEGLVKKIKFGGSAARMWRSRRPRSPTRAANPEELDVRDKGPPRRQDARDRPQRRQPRDQKVVLALKVDKDADRDGRRDPAGKQVIR